nr:unknown [Lotus japonicus]
MWEILQRTESEVIDKCHKRKQLPFWRIFVWSNHHEASSQSAIKQT